MAERVVCRSEVEYAERPIALYWCGERLQIVEILSRWRTPEGKWFRVIAQNGGIFEIHYNEALESWNIDQISSSRG